MDWNARVRAAFGTHQPDDDVIEELAQHARTMFEAARADGCSADEATRRVDVQIALWRDDAAMLRRRVSRSSAVVVDAPAAASATSGIDLALDIRHAARLLRRQPRYALVVILMMTLGIGATTTLFSVTFGVLLKPLPWPAGDRLVTLSETRGGNAPRFGAFSNTAYAAWRDDPKTVDGIAAWTLRVATLAGDGEPERVRVGQCTASLFRVLGAAPLAGRFFADADEAPDGGTVVVLSERLWRRRFGGDSAVVGTVIHLDGRPHTIVGVMPDHLAYPDRNTLAWAPFHVAPPAGNFMSMFNAVARLRPGVTAVQAAAEGTGRGRFAADTGLTTTAIFGSTGPIEVLAMPLRDAVTADVRRPLIALLAAVVLLFVAAIANVASLQLARATARRREMAIRAAIGASVHRVTRQLLVESLVLACAGGVLGVGLAWLLHRAAPSVLPADFPRIDDIDVSVPVLAFAAAAAMLAGLAFGLFPALQVRRLNLAESLGDDGAAAVAAGGRSRTAQARQTIMAAQVAIACVLLVGASLLGRSFVSMLRADRGYDPSNVLTARLPLPASTYTPVHRHAIVTEILERLASIPGVTTAGFTSDVPLTPGGSTAAFTMRSPRDGSRIEAQASPRLVSPRGLMAMGMRVVAGRGFTEDDNETSQLVVVVNQSFARKYLGDSPLGAHLPLAGYGQPNVPSPDTTVVGVVEDVRYVAARDASQPEMYYSYRQMRGTLPVPSVMLLVRTDRDSASIATAVRTAVRAAESSLVLESVATLEDRVVAALARPRLYAVLLAAFAILAVAVAAVGVFGALSYAVAQRSRELAIRTALGARRADILGLVLRQSLVSTVIGTGAGLLGAAAITRWIGSLLHGVTTRDPATFAAVPVVILMVAGLSCLAPARRAARLDPIRVLRQGL
jgi:predicted permease